MAVIVRNGRTMVKVMSGLRDLQSVTGLTGIYIYICQRFSPELKASVPPQTH